MASGRLEVEDAAGRVGLVGLQRRIVAEERRAVRADLFALVAEVDEDVRMIVRDRGAGAHEFLHADFDDAMSAVVLEMRNIVAGHDDLRMRLAVSGMNVAPDLVAPLYNPSSRLCSAKVRLDAEIFAGIGFI